MVNCSFSGVNQVRRFHVTVGHGGVCIAVLDIVPQLFLPAQDGTLFFTDGLQYVIIPGCRLDKSSLSFTTNGQVCRLTILGPTWRWYRAGIDGVYNVYKADGSIQAGTERSPQQLAGLLFESMLVPQFDVSLLPENTRPFVGWRGAMALDELRNLCHGLGCDVVFNVFGGVAEIWPLGYGAGLPDGNSMSVDFGLDMSEPPDVIKVYCGPSIFQSKLKLEAVMPDSDGVIMRIEDVDYAPTGGWVGADMFDPLPASTDEVAKALARKYLYRMWRVVSQANGSQVVPGYGSVGGIEDILPLYDKQVDNYDDAGIFEKDGYLEGTIALDHQPQPYENSDDHTRIDVQYTLDKERGIIMSSVPLVKLTDDDRWDKADVFLVCSYNVRNPFTFNDEYLSLEYRIANNGTGFLPVHRPELVRRVVGQYNKASLTGYSDNQQELGVQMEAQAVATLSEFQQVGAVVRRYRGLQPIRLNGAIRQVSWMGQCEGQNRGFFTMASFNTEFECGIDGRDARIRRTSANRARVTRDLYDYDLYRSQKQGVRQK